MSIERLKHMKESLMCCVESQMAHLDEVDAEELGEVIDMIKDIEEAIYYCTVVEAMKGEPAPVSYYGRDMDRENGRMYYDGNGYKSRVSGEYPHDYNPSSISGQYQNDYYPAREHPEMRDSREGRSPQRRKMYMESKALHQDKGKQMMELEKYMQELSKDLAEMIEGSSPEEKQMLHQKIAELANKLK